MFPVTNNNNTNHNNNNDTALHPQQNTNGDDRATTPLSLTPETTTPPPSSLSLTKERVEQSSVIAGASAADARYATGCDGDEGSQLDDEQDGTSSSSDRCERVRPKLPPRSGKKHNPSSNIIPGVEHVFFEDEWKRMEEKNVIILAVDDGCHSEIAFKFYKDNVDRPGYVLHIVHHSDAWSHYKPVEGGPSASHCQEIAEKAKGMMDVVEQKYRKMMEDNNVEGEYFVVHGKDAWHDILQHQENSDAILIVMGTRGAGALSRTFRGSVSDSVVHHAHVPVLVCCHPKD